MSGPAVHAPSDPQDAAKLEQVVYLSRDRMRPDELEALVADAAVRNAARAITGALMFGGGHFLQVLEGPPAAVEALVAKIAVDTRHENFEILLRRPVADRQFPHWGMVLIGLGGAEEWVDSLNSDRSLERLDRVVAHLSRRLADENRP